MKTPAIYHVASFHAFFRAFRASALKCAGVFRKKAKLYEGSLDDALVSAANKRKTPKGGKDRALGDLAARGALQHALGTRPHPAPRAHFAATYAHVTTTVFQIVYSALSLFSWCLRLTQRILVRSQRWRRMRRSKRSGTARWSLQATRRRARRVGGVLIWRWPP